MEQLSDLKDQNVVLQRRVQYLEDMKLIQPLSVPRTGRPSGEEKIQGQFVLPDVSISAEPGVDDEEQPNEQWVFDWNAVTKPKRKTVSGPTGDVTKGLGGNMDKDRFRSKSTGKSDLEEKGSPTLSAKSKISKWAKVKEAFKWEKVGHDQRTGKGGLSIDRKLHTLFLTHCLIIQVIEVLQQEENNL